jgi:hypothetical protein
MRSLDQPDHSFEAHAVSNEEIKGALLTFFEGGIE